MSVAALERPRIHGRLLVAHDPGHPAHLSTYGALPPFDRRRMLAEVEASGLTGRGGAGFPTATKLNSVAQHRRTTVVANGTEGEPASAKDLALLTRNPHLVLDGLAVAARLVGARDPVVAVASLAAAQALDAAIAERAWERARLVVVPDRFVVGEESALVSAVRGGDAKPTGKRPFESGILVQNVETLANLALVARFGASWFRAAGTDDEPGTALATVGGAVARRGVVEFELGTSLGDLVSRCGGLTDDVDAVLIGGYFGRWLTYDPDLRLTAEALRARGGALGARVIIPLARTSCGVAEVARVTRYLAGESAGQCGPCVFGLAALADELDEFARGRGGNDRVAQLKRQIARRGACAHPDGALGFATSGLALFAEEVERHRRGICTATNLEPVLPTP